MSAVIIAKDAAATIEQCLDACVRFNEVILLIDEACSDDTAIIAQQYANVKIHHSPFLGFGKMKQHAVDLALHQWICSIDSDEVLSDAGINELDLLTLEEEKVYAIHRHNFYKDRCINACGWNNDYPIRIFNKSITGFTKDEIHESIKTQGLHIVKLSGPLLHYAYTHENQLAAKADRYATLYASQHYRYKHVFRWTPYVKSAFTFFKDFILRSGIWYGKDGFTISKYNALGAFLKYQYLYLKNKSVNHTLIVTTYNRPDALATVLHSIAQQSVMPDQIVIADDGSTNDTAQVIARFKDSLSGLEHVWHEDRGFRLAAIRNKAILKSKGAFISLIDGDMVLQKDFVKTIQTLAQKKVYLQGKRVLLGQSLTDAFINKKISSIFFWTGGLTNRWNTISWPLMSKFFTRKYNTIKAVKGCSMHFWKEDAEAINGFNESFVGWGREDSEFLCRLLNAGIVRKNIILGAVAYHLYHHEASRTTLAENDQILADCIAQKKSWCVRGLVHKAHQSNKQAQP